MNPSEIEKAALLAEIDAAFANVTREGGVSWSETEVLDGQCATSDQRIKARAKDTEKTWNELVEHNGWETDRGTGGFSFLDSIGFRYYLPAAMKRSLLLGYDVGVTGHLSIGSKKNSHREWKIERFVLLNARQRQCVAHYLLYLERYLNIVNPSDAWEPRAALNEYWKTFI